jgi:peptidoglycan/LPS O-acetylase OafA/YrhL
MNFDDGRGGSQGGRPHFGLLDGLRGVAAAAVVLYHFGDRAALPLLLPRGYLAVDFFFVLSGFVIARAYGGRIHAGLNLSRFVGMRLIRLLPMLLPGTLFGALLEIGRPHLGAATGDWPTVALAFVLGALAIPLPIATNLEHTIFPINGPVWSVFFEIVVNIAFFYVIRSSSAPFLSRLMMVFGAAGLMACEWHYGTLNIGFLLFDWFGGFPRVTYSFFAGVVLAMRPLPRIRLPAAVFPIVILAIMMTPLSPGPLGDLFDSLVVLLVFPLIVCTAAASEPAHLPWLLSTFPGELSYPLYALHYPFVRAITYGTSRFGFSPSVRLGLALATLCLTCCLAVIALKAYDVPVRAWLSRSIRRRVGSAAR